VDRVEGLRGDDPTEADRPSLPLPEPATVEPEDPSPYTRADLYDLLFHDFAADLQFYLGAARAAVGPSLDVGCGTGRVLLRALEARLDMDGLDASEEMLERLRTNAAARGLDPRVTLGDMRSFRLPRRYASVMIPFNAFAHNLTAEDQLATLRSCLQHLAPGGRLVFDVFSATPSMVAAPVTDPVLEMEAPHAAPGWRLRMYDGRRLDVFHQTQRSHIAIEEVDPGGQVARTHRFIAVVRWIYPAEMELLLRLAGFARWEITGDFDGSPAAGHQGAIVVSAWKGG